MRSCKDISTLLSRSMDEKISWRERWALKTHLMMCRSCSTLAKQMQFLRAASAAAAAEDIADSGPGPGPHLTDEARERIRERLRREQADAPSEPVPE